MIQSHQSLTILKAIQILLSFIPFIWVLLFCANVWSGVGDDYVFWRITFVGMLIALHSVWICILVTLIISMINRKFTYQRTYLFVFLLSVLACVFIIKVDPGGYFSRFIY